VRDYVIERLGDAGGVPIADETGFVKKGARSAGVRRQHSGTLTFIPSATKGTVVRGFIGVDTFNSYTVAGDELVNITYTVG
jgi:SRSO17 transposase